MLTQRIVAGSVETGELQVKAGPGAAETMMVMLIKSGAPVTVAEIDKVALYRFAATIMGYLGKDVAASMQEADAMAGAGKEQPEAPRSKPPVGFNGGASTSPETPQEAPKGDEPPTTAPAPEPAPEAPEKGQKRAPKKAKR